MQTTIRAFATSILVTLMFVFAHHTDVGAQTSKSKPSGSGRSVWQQVEARCFKPDLNQLAIRLPIPSYPPTARRKNVFGKITIKVFVNERGRVYHTVVVDGPSLLRAPALRSARDAEFTPFTESDKPIKCAGLLTYRFVSQVNTSAELTTRKLEEPGNNSISITRRFDNDLEKRLIGIAEAQHPATKKAPECSEVGTPQLREANMWSCGCADGTYLPYAITSDALAYYINHSREARRNRERSCYLYRTTLNYECEIMRQAKYQSGGVLFHDVYVVTMKLYWFQTCDQSPSMCGMTFQKSRTVVLDKEGVILDVQGDGQQMVMFT